MVVIMLQLGTSQPPQIPDGMYCDIAGQAEFDPTNLEIRVGDTIRQRIIMQNEALGSRCYYLPYTIMAFFSFPSIGDEDDGINNLPRAYEFVRVESVTDGMGNPHTPLFDWQFDYDNFVFYGINQDTIFDSQKGGEEVVTYTVRAVPCNPSDPDCFYPKTWTSSYNTRALGYWSADDPANNWNRTGLIIIGLPLPIELKSFTTKTLDCKTSYIRWETASELNNEYMELQRSADGYNYTALTKFSGNNVGNKTSHVYEYTDTDLRGGQSYYYRLKQVDYDGKVKVFDPTIVRTELCFGDIAMRVNPNPGIDKVSVLMEGIDESKASTLTIINGIGELVRVIDLVPGTKEKDIDVSALTPGVYTFKWTDGEVSPMQQRFVKIR